VEQHIGFIKGLKFMRELIQGGIDGDWIFPRIQGLHY
jgi:hypothetical protein